MDAVFQVISSVFWGLLVLSGLVFIHEGGHFLAARAFGLRVKEFFLGLPCRFNLHVTSKKTGTDYGVTPLLLGGYTKVCGMEEGSTKDLARVLYCVQKKGVVAYTEIAAELNLDEDVVLEALATLNDWASIEELPTQAEKTEGEEALVVGTLERDKNLLTKYDKAHNFAEAGTTQAGEPRVPEMSEDEFLEKERSRTYLSRGFFGRFLILVAGALVNIAFGYLLLVFVLSAVGLDQATNANTLGGVTQGSLAETAGLVAGDTITTVNGTPTDSWQAIVEALQDPLSSGDAFEITYEHKGVVAMTTVLPTAPGELLGISASTQTVRLGFVDACKQAWNYITMTLAYVLQLFQPSKVANVISQSTSVVGISVMASTAAASGLASILMLIAAVSLSLGIMNLLPIPPLDGGKIVIEAIQAIIRRPLPTKVIAVINFIGIALFILLFVVLLRQDIVRFILGG